MKKWLFVLVAIIVAFTIFVTSDNVGEAEVYKNEQYKFQMILPTEFSTKTEMDEVMETELKLILARTSIIEQRYFATITINYFENDEQLDNQRLLEAMLNKITTAEPIPQIIETKIEKMGENEVVLIEYYLAEDKVAFIEAKILHNNQVYEINLYGDGVDDKYKKLFKEMLKTFRFL